eukprot:GHVU01120155.1.p1 GENE.GHVU01120155.1~~GHVU01120155.1.p1  ORF type:complete len:226 (-),score=44.38 GHVU01120155.1:373-1050(-)
MKKKTKDTSTRKHLRDKERLLKYIEEKKGEVRPEAKKETEELEKKLKYEHKRKAFWEKLQKRYSKIKFFELRKIERKIRQCRRRLAEAATTKGDDDETQKLKDLLKQHTLDKLYVDNYPKDKPYIALFPSKDCDNEAAVAKKREELREFIYKQVRKKNQSAGVDKVTGDLRDSFFTTGEPSKRDEGMASKSQAGGKGARGPARPSARGKPQQDPKSHILFDSDGE